MITFDWRDHIENAISCYIESICNGKYTEENMIQCCIDLCGYIDTRTDELLRGGTENMKMLRSICDMDHVNSLIAVLQVIEMLEKNISVDDNITDEKYDIIMEFLEDQYCEIRTQFIEERWKRK